MRGFWQIMFLLDVSWMLNDEVFQCLVLPIIDKSAIILPRMVIMNDKMSRCPKFIERTCVLACTMTKYCTGDSFLHQRRSNFAWVTLVHGAMKRLCFWALNPTLLYLFLPSCWKNEAKIGIFHKNSKKCEKLKSKKSCFCGLSQSSSVFVISQIIMGT